MFDWAEFLHLADDLATAGDEARRRSAISRAYYAAFNRAKERASIFGLSTDPDECESDHQACWNAYQTDPGRRRALRKVGERGKRLRDLRNAADYDSSAGTSLMAKASEAVDDARRLINDIEASAASS